MDLPKLPPPPLPDDLITSYQPPEVELIEQAARNGDLIRVEEIVQQLLHRPCPPSEPLKPQPRWLNGSIIEAITRHDVECIPLCDGDKEMVSWLLDHGADPNARCVWDYTPTSRAMLTAPLELIDYLFARGADARRGELLQYAVQRKQPDALAVVRRVVEHGASINKVKYEGEPKVFREREPLGLGTPLHRAAELGRADIVGYLLEKGADPLKLDSRGKIPRYWADVKGHLAVGILLMNAEDDRRGKLRSKETSAL